MTKKMTLTARSKKTIEGVKKIHNEEQQTQYPSYFPIKSNAGTYLVNWTAGVLARQFLNVQVQYLYGLGAFTAGISIFVYSMFFPLYSKIFYYMTKLMNLILRKVFKKKRSKALYRWNKERDRIIGITLLVPTSLFIYWFQCVPMFRAGFRMDIFIYSGLGFLAIYFLVLILEVIFNIRLENFSAFSFNPKEEDKFYRAIMVFLICLFICILYIYFIVIRYTGVDIPV